MRLSDHELQRGPSDLVPIGDPRPVNGSCAATLGNGLVALFTIKAPTQGLASDAPTPPGEPGVGNQTPGGGVISPV